jgi:hypothetical protein
MRRSEILISDKESFKLVEFPLDIDVISYPYFNKNKKKTRKGALERYGWVFLFLSLAY